MRTALIFEGLTLTAAGLLIVSAVSRAPARYRHSRLNEIQQLSTGTPDVGGGVPATSTMATVFSAARGAGAIAAISSLSATATPEASSASVQ